MKKKYYIVALFLMFALALSFSGKAEAASQQNLKENITYTRKLTGSANHKIRFTQVKSGRYYKSLKLLIDGKTVKTISGTQYETLRYEVYLLNVATNRTLIAICPHSDSDLMPFFNLYEYKNKKLNYLMNFCSLTRAKTYEKANALLTPWARCKVRGVKTNQITLTWTDQTPATGNICMNVAYKISGNKVTKVGYSSEVRLSTSNMNHPTWNANRDMKGQKSIGSGVYSLEVQEGDEVTIFAITVKGGKRYMQLIDADGNKGWVYIPDFIDEDPLAKYDDAGNIIFGYFNQCRFIG